MLICQTVLRILRESIFLEFIMSSKVVMRYIFFCKEFRYLSFIHSLYNHWTFMMEIHYLTRLIKSVPQRVCFLGYAQEIINKLLTNIFRFLGIGWPKKVTSSLWHQRWHLKDEKEPSLGRRRVSVSLNKICCKVVLVWFGLVNLLGENWCRFNLLFHQFERS